MYSSVSHPPWGVTVFSSHYSSQLCCGHYSSFPFFSTIGFQKKSLLRSNRFPRFFTTTSAPSYSVKSSCVQSLKYNKASIHPYHCPFAKSPNGPIWVFVIFFLFVLSCLVLGFVFLISYTVVGRPKVGFLPGLKY